MCAVIIAIFSFTRVWIMNMEKKVASFRCNNYFYDNEDFE